VNGPDPHPAVVSNGSGPEPPWMGALDGFDRVVDGWFDQVRGNPTADTAAMALSNLGDYGFVWSVVAAAKGRRKAGRRRAARALSAAGLTSYGVNALVKGRVGRDRPDGAGGAGNRVRTPTSTSFPSGHTLAAFCTAVVLADSPAELAAYLAFATAVGASRVHLRAHHPSDVAGGAVIGLVTGALTRTVVKGFRGKPREQRRAARR
jgi:undecaprenyl-diphosphatase